MCGGTGVGRGWGRVRRGLSPRVRGNRGIGQGGIVGGGSIPACAGEPASQVQIQLPLASLVYPRVCGGTTDLAPLYSERYGLSPRVRGNRAGAALPAGLTRSIPACAGEPAWTAPTSAPASVYPRVCGGTRQRILRLPKTPGLSPRVRGNLLKGNPPTGHHGSIPACAGEPHPPATAPHTTGVYPRVCGGTAPPRRLGPRAVGLSPRVRGNPTGMRWPFICERSIPACAGEPPRPLPGVWRRRVYPRVCGGTSPVVAPPHCWTGLSPRVRGNRR